MELLAQVLDSDQEDQDKRLVLSNTDLTLVEGEKGTAFKVRLSSKPKELEVVKVAIQSDNEENITVSPTSLEFTEDNWEKWQDINISLKNYEIDENNLSVTISLFPSGAGYDESSGESLDLTLRKLAKQMNILLDIGTLKISHDNTEKSIEIDTKLTITDNAKLNVTEGESLTFYVSLNSKPIDNIKMDALLTDEDKNPIDLDKDESFRISSNSLDFNESNFDYQQVIKLDLVDNKNHEKDKTVRICFDFVGVEYNESVILDLTIIDNDTPELVLNSSELIVTEGGSGSFSVELGNEPIEPVVVRVVAVKNKDEDLEKVFLNSEYFVKSFYFGEENLKNAKAEQLQNLKAGFPQLFPIKLDDVEEIRRTYQALVSNFSHFNSDRFVNSHFLVFSADNYNVPQPVTVFTNEKQHSGGDRLVTIALDPSGEGYDNDQFRKKIKVEIKDKPSNPPLILTFTLFITINIFALRFAANAKINDIDIKFQNKENDLLSEIDEKVADIKTEVEEIKEDVEEIKDKI